MTEITVQCFETVDWMMGRASSLHEMLLQQFLEVHF